MNFKVFFPITDREFRKGNNYCPYDPKPELRIYRGPKVQNRLPLEDWVDSIPTENFNPPRPIEPDSDPAATATMLAAGFHQWHIQERTA